jgi:hypothetical protein
MTHWKHAEGRVVSVDSTCTRGRLQLTVAFTYRVADELYKGKFYTFDSVQEGDSVDVRYDLSNPNRNDLDTRQTRINRIVFAVALPITVAVLWLLWFTVLR